jgi:uncharacterized iron-regulated membrane protein
MAEVGNHYFRVEAPPASHPAIDEWIAGAGRAYGDYGKISFIIGPGFSLGFADTANLGIVGADGKRSTIAIDSSNGRPLGHFEWENSYSYAILLFHARLYPPSWGADLLAWLGVGMLVSMATGLYLWWPRNRNWYIALTLKRGARGRRRLLDLHNLFAVYLYVPLLVLAVTGIYFLKPQWINPAVSLVSVPRTPDAKALAGISKPGSCSVRTTPGQAVDVALARFPSSKFVALVIPKQEQQPYVVRLAAPNNLYDKGQTVVYVDPECPVLLTAIDGEIRVASEIFEAVMFPLHRDLMLGWVGSIIVCLSGLLLPFSFVTGVLLWLDKRKNRKRLG